MTRIVVAWVFGALLASAGLLLVRAVAPGRHELELDVYLLVLGATALLAVMSWVLDAVPSETGSRLEDELDRPREDPPRIPELDRLERELYMGASSAFDLHYRLRAVVREIAAGRLERRGLRLDSESDAVRDVLGEDVWELVRTDRDPPSNRQAAGPGIGTIREIVEQLERV